MSILSPTGNPASDKKLWWRCVFIAAAVQAVLFLLSCAFKSTILGLILLLLFSLTNPICAFLAILVLAASENPSPILWIILLLSGVLFSFVLGTVFYFGAGIAHFFENEKEHRR